MLFIIAKFRIKWFYNNCLLSKISTIGKAAFIFFVLPASSRVSMNLVSLNLKNLWIIQMVWQLCIYYFLNKLYAGSFIFNIWCIENPYKWMDMWTTSLLKFNTNSMIICFPQWIINYNFFEKYLTLYWKCLATRTGLLLNRLHR